MDITENEQEPLVKQPARVLAARLTILGAMLRTFGVDDKIWSWQPVFQMLVAPSLFHPSPDVRLAAVEVIVLLHQWKGAAVKAEVDLIEDLKPNLLKTITKRLGEQTAPLPKPVKPSKMPLESVTEV